MRLRALHVELDPIFIRSVQDWTISIAKEIIHTFGLSSNNKNNNNIIYAPKINQEATRNDDMNNNATLMSKCESIFEYAILISCMNEYY